MDTKKLRQKILDLAIRGKLVPQDPNDEPASLLLQRIRDEKERLIKEGKIKRSKTIATDEEIEAPFEIPESWEWVKLEDILLLLSGQDFPPSKYNSESKGLPYIIGASNIENEKLLVNRWTETPSVISKLNDVLVVCKGAGVGKIAMNDVGDVHIARQIQAVRDETGIINSKYIKLCIASNISSIIANANGLIPGLKRELLLSLMVPIAPIKEQERIVSAIEHLYSYIDILESNEGDLLNAIDQAKSKILDLAIHGKLVPQDPNDEPAIELLKRINPKFEACDDENLPSGWTLCNLGDLYNIVSAKRVLKSDWKHKGIPFYRAREIVKLASEGHVDNDLYISESHYEEMKTNYSVPNPSDIMMSAVGTIGKTYIVKENDVFYYKDASVLCLQNTNNMYSAFISIVLSSQFLQDQMFEQSKGTTVDTITIEKAKSYCIPLPPYQEQLRIVAKIEELFGVLDGIKEALEA